MTAPKTTRVSRTFLATTGILTFGMIAYYIVFVVLFIHLFTSGFGHAGSTLQPVRPPTLFITLFILNGVGIIVSLGLLVAYILHVMKNTRLNESSRIVWALLLLFVGPIAMAIYWYQQLWVPYKSAR